MALKPHHLRPAPGARRRRRRVGRGDGSGRGSYSGRGIKGQQARGGKAPRPGFEGGQLPLILRQPHKRGFTPSERREYASIPVGRLAERFPGGARVTPQDLLAAGLVRDPNRPIKVLGDGEVPHPLTVVAHRFSASAKQKIKAAGGSIEELERPKEKEEGDGPG